MAVDGLALPVLNSRFHDRSKFRASNHDYQLLPMRFTALDDRRMVLTNLVGESAVVDRARVADIVERRLDRNGELYAELASKHFILDPTDRSALSLLAVKYRTKQAHLADFTALHLFVVTLRCDHSCPYCQVSRVSEDRAAFDMTQATADRAIELLFQSPSPALKVEFQGGESLMNFPLVQHIVRKVEERAAVEGRDISFVAATNLAPLTDEMLGFFRNHGVLVSTSLDGPAELHNANRPRPGGNSHALAVDGIRRCREALGLDAVSALMTTTMRSLDQPEAIIDEYVARGFRSIFLRWLSPYGFAARTGKAIGYPVERWNEFYERGLRHILRLNREGVAFREEYATIVLGKMLTPYGGRYVDLQSPSSLGIAVAVYNYDGDVYASDESRMLAEMGDTTFRLGNVHRDSYEQLFLSERLLGVLDSTMTDTIPGCADCAFEPFCGTDPTFHHATQHDMVGHRPTSAFCRRNIFVFRLLVRILHDEPESRAVLESWTT